MADVPLWRVTGDWFDVCNCTIPCPCTFAQAPSSGDCEGILAWHIRAGTGDVSLDGFNVLALGSFEGNLWDGETKASADQLRDRRRSRLLERRDPREGDGPRHGADRADEPSGRPRAGPQRPRRRGRAGPSGDMGARDGEPRGRIRLEVRVGRPFEQALPRRLERAGRVARFRTRPLGRRPLLARVERRVLDVQHGGTPGSPMSPLLSACRAAGSGRCARSHTARRARRRRPSRRRRS